jgi:hypothetical protein
MVEAIEDYFVPVLIYNNKESDEKLLKQFGEPSWNNPVTRFLKADLTDVIARRDGVWEINPMAMRMVAALNAAEREVPPFLKLLAENTTAQKKATFAMHCYWEGEGNLGQVVGVSDTVSAWVGGLEVVEVSYDPQQVDYATLVKEAQSMKCATRVFTHSDEQFQQARELVGDRAVRATVESRLAKLSDQKYYLRNTPGLRNLPLTRLQSTKINSRLGKRKDFRDLLSPRQMELLQQIEPFLRRASSKSFEDLIFPEDDSALPEHWSKVIERINATKD